MPLADVTSWTFLVQLLLELVNLRVKNNRSGISADPLWLYCYSHSSSYSSKVSKLLLLLGTGWEACIPPYSVIITLVSHPHEDLCVFLPQWQLFLHFSWFCTKCINFDEVPKCTNGQVDGTTISVHRTDLSMCLSRVGLCVRVWSLGQVHQSVWQEAAILWTTWQRGFTVEGENWEDLASQECPPAAHTTFHAQHVPLTDWNQAGEGCSTSLQLHCGGCEAREQR